MKQLSRSLLIVLILAGTGAASRAQQPAEKPEAAITAALSAACQQDDTAFAKSLTADNATAYRALPGPQRTAIMKRFVQLEDAGRPLVSTGAAGHAVLHCSTPSIETQMRFGEVRLRENLAFVPMEMEIPVPDEPARSVTFGLVLEGGDWKLLSVGLMLLDIPALAKQWVQADLEEREDNAIADLQALATALETYRSEYGNLPDTLAPLGPAPASGISDERPGLVDADLAAGNKGGYTIRYTIIPAGGDLSEEGANKLETFTLAATPNEYGATGRRSFFLDSEGVLRGADKKGALANSADPRIGPA